MRAEKLSWSQGTFVFLYLLLMTVLYGLRRNFSGDPYWHIKLGEIMVQYRTFAKFDLLSYTSPGTYYINHEWLHDIIIYFFYRTFGETGGLLVFQLIFIFLFALMIFLIVRLFSKKLVYPFIAIPLVFLVDLGRVQPRPHIMADVFFSLFICLWERYRLTNNYKRLYILIPLTIFWTNLHGSFQLGLGILSLMWIGELIEYYWRKDPRETSIAFLKHGGVVILLCSLSSLLNPYGIELHISIYQTVFGGEIGRLAKYIVEWRSFMAQQWAFVRWVPFLFLVSAASFYINRKNARLSHILAFCALTVLTWQAARFRSYLAVMAVLVTAYNLYKNPVKFKPVYPYVACAFFLVYSIYFYIERFHIIYPFHTLPQIAPKKLVDFMEENNIHGRAFHRYSTGGYLAFRRWPGELIFMDGRTPVFKDFFLDYIEARTNASAFTKLENKFNFDYVFLDTTFLKSGNGLATNLINNKDWKLVYFNPEEGVLLLKDVPKFKYLIEKYELKDIPELLKDL